MSSGEHEPGQPTEGPEQAGAGETVSPVPRVYVASLSDYNAGRLHGTWLDANTDPEEIHAGITAMLAASREPSAEEWAIHDYEGFGPLRLGEWEPIERVAAIGRGIAEHGLAFAAWADLQDSTEPIDSDQFQDDFMGAYGLREEFAEDLLDQWGFDLDLIDGIPDSLRLYLRIDSEGLVRDMELGGDIDIVSHGDGIWVFWS